MRDRIDALARRHGLGSEVVQELLALLGEWETQAPTEVMGIEDPSGAAATRRPPPPTASLDDRYEDLAALGRGGMGEVRRVHDHVLGRDVAIKALHPALMERAGARERFLDEARATARLQHPSIIPVHDLGQTNDGRPWFTMKEVQGRTLGEVIAEVHRASVHRWEVAPSGWNLHRIASALHAVCLAVDHAHRQGVVHRDLKPDNIMIGAQGEVMVLDWGLALLTDDADTPAASPRRGVAGTPAFMAPEQARGELDRIGIHTDVYALGAILYEVLSGRPPYQGPPSAILQQVIAGPPPPVGRWAPAQTFDFDVDSATDVPTVPTPPEELVHACECAMAPEPGDRFADAAALAGAIEAWLDGSKRRERSDAMVRRALDLDRRADAIRARSAALRDEARLALAGIPTWAPEDAKVAGWALEDRAADAELTAHLLTVEATQELATALRFDPDHADAHARLARRFQLQLQQAEGHRDHRSAAEARTLLAAHTQALPTAHPARLEAESFLRGDGALTLITDPPGAEVLLYRYTPHHRRLVEVFERSLGPTPLRAVPLPMGSYLCMLRHPSHADTRYPVHITRRGHWSSSPPSGEGAIPLLPREALDADDVYVPAGWAALGGDPHIVGLPGGRRWVEGFVAQRFPVTNARYLTFLNDLVVQGRTGEALQHAPRERSGSADRGALLYGFEEGVFALMPDVDGDLWQPDWPVMMIDARGAMAFATWLARRTGKAWRLPTEVEWEKLARGVDGRWFPWGDQIDPAWACVTDSHHGRRLPQPVDSFPVDVSPYGARGLGGNVADWTADHATPTSSDEDALRIVRGGTWSSVHAGARCAFRNQTSEHFRSALYGFRLVYTP